MNRAEARWSTEGTSPGEARAPSPSLVEPIRTPSAVPVSSTRRARSSAETLRGSADPFADTEGALPDAAGAQDWCVDRGEELRSMSTFELWAALERAEVAPWMRVWREGMECWTPAGELLELAWATAGAPQPGGEPERIESGPIARVAAEGVVSEPIARVAAERVAAGPIELVAAEAITGPVPTVDRSPARSEASLGPDEASEPLGHTPVPVLPSRSPSRDLDRPPSPSPAQVRAARWVTAGSLVAAFAIAAAFVVAAGGGAEAPRESALVTSVAAATPPLRAPQASPPEVSPPEVEDPPRPEPARREERGQRRLPRGGGRAYGR